MPNFVRVLKSRSRFLMLDEPVLGIAPPVVDQLMEVPRFLQPREGPSMLLVEQNLPAAPRRADRGYVLQTGRIVLEGTGQQLLESDLVRQAYLGM